MDSIAAINQIFDTLGLSPELEAFDLSDLNNHLVLTDTQEVTVYRSPAGCLRWLRTLDETATLEDVYQVLAPQQTDIRVYEDHGLWRQDHEEDEAEAEG